MSLMLSELFDWAEFIVIGSGIGASAFAHEMSQNGHKVLVLEAGSWIKRDNEDWDPHSILIRERYADKNFFGNISVRQYGAKIDTPLSYRPVVGGMSAFYGAAAFRMRKRDFDRFPSKLNYDAFEAYYSRAETLMRVQGDDRVDPSAPPRRHALVEPPALAKPSMRIQNAGRKLGLLPFRIPLAIDRSRCSLCNTCDGFPCVIEAKVDGASLLKSANDNLRVVTGFFVTKLVQKDGRVIKLECLSEEGVLAEYPVKKVVLGAGAIGSPALLLRSETMNALPSHSLLGRYLMRHANAVVGAVFLERINPERSFSKQIVFADLYESQRQSSGLAVGVIQDIYTPAASVMRHFAPKLIGPFAGLLSQFIQNLLCVAEDEPQFKNRVFIEDEKVRLHHEYTAEDIRRRDLLIAQAKKILRKAGGRFSQVMPISSFSHALGTLRMGESEQDSCADIETKIWGTENLWCVDASVLPVSAGVNPSLTIVANALRVADLLNRKSQ